MRKFNYNDTLALLNQVADLVGRETTYKDRYLELTGEVFNGTCANFALDKDGSVVPACIVGVAIGSILPVESWARVYDTPNRDHEFGENQYTNAESLAFYLEKLGLARFTAKARMLLRLAQRHQDMGETWGESIALAIQGVESTLSDQ